MTETIYCLKDPDTYEIVYVGRTKRALVVRLAGHIMEAKDSPKCLWVASLKSKGKCPEIEPIENVELLQASERERFWITHYTPKFNINSGGKRAGAGRPKSEPTETVSFRVNAKVLEKVKSIFVKELNQKVNDFLKRLANKK